MNPGCTLVRPSRNLITDKGFRLTSQTVTLEFPSNTHTNPYGLRERAIPRILAFRNLHQYFE
jgi:hypothetical protein